MKPKPTVGQTLYAVRRGNRAGIDEQLFPVVVTKVGRKYFTVKQDKRHRFEIVFHMASWREKTEYTPSFCIYEKEQDYFDDLEQIDLRNRLRDRFSDYGMSRMLSLDALRQIMSIIYAELSKTE